MFLPIVFVLTVILFILSLAILIATGICIGVANLMVYFIPALESATLVPAAILTTVTIITLGSAFKLWIAEDVKRSLNRYYEEEEDDMEDDEPPEPPPVTGHRKGKYRVN